MTIRTLYAKYREIISYLVWGVATTAVNYGAYYLCRQFENLYFLFANALAWLVSVLFAFWANKCFVFESKSWAPRVALPELGKFAGARIFSGVLETALLWASVDLLHFHEGVTKLLASVVVVILNYVFSKVFIFHGGKNHG